MSRVLGVTIATWSFLLSLAAWLVTAQSVASRAYTPVVSPCPDDFNLVRMVGQPGNQTLSADETSYVQARRSQVLPQAWKAYLANVEATNVTLPPYVSRILQGLNSTTPTLGIATSGGSYRAAIFGAGVLNVLDGRNATSNGAGLGGLLQAATYLAGLSGGSWFLTSLVQSNFPTMQDLIFGYADAPVSDSTWGGWNAEYGLLTPSSNIAVDLEYLVDVIAETRGKAGAGFPVTFADYWSRALARHFVNGTSSSNFFDESYTHGAGVLWSSVAETEAFRSHAIPFPIVVADSSVAGQNSSNTLAGELIPLSNPIFEFNVFEMGSFDPALSAFTPTRYLGTRNESVCVTNYDQLSFVAGTSSDLLNELNISSILGPEVAGLLPSASGLETVYPNAFYGVARQTFIGSNETDLTLVDGGEDGQNVPLQPLLVTARGVDTILVIDASSNVDNFADGSSLVATQDWSTLLSPAYPFPRVPTSAEEFITQNLATRPTFFGCDTTHANRSTPLVVYLANGGPPRDGQAPRTNTSTYQLSYNSSDVQAMLDQISIIATQGYPADASVEVDPEWPACLACAIVDRAREKAREARSGVCESCFARYCWS